MVLSYDKEKNKLKKKKINYKQIFIIIFIYLLILHKLFPFELLTSSYGKCLFILSYKE